MNNRLTPIKVELFKAVDRNDSNMVRKCINQGADVNFQYDNGVTCLMHACQHDLLEIAQLLVTLGADVNIKDSLGNTALMILCLVGNNFIDLIKFVIFLLISGADINIRDNSGHTVLYIVKHFFPDEKPIRKQKIINILEKWPATMGIIGLQQSGLYNSMDLSNIEDLIEFMGETEGGKKRKTKKNKKKTNKRNKKSNKSKKRK